MEEDAENGARELARLLLQGHFDLRARREEVELSALDTGGRAQLAAGRTRLEKGHRRQLATVVGPVTVTRCALRAPGLPNRYPADQVLGLPRERHSLGLRRLVVLEAVRGSYDHALEAIERRPGRGWWANARPNSSCGQPRWTSRPSMPRAPLTRQRARRCWCSASTARGS
ncbi:hypothetical protein [Streptomyces sp. SID12488]|uniref:hypothetical protein n=1 Tax=Streptomyces sp. SID12488 TaxID=2706040 RepID=UPI001EF279CF|nr:hypothetical protein [Streptomyces sp. SID12488]